MGVAYGSYVTDKICGISAGKREMSVANALLVKVRLLILRRDGCRLGIRPPIAPQE